MKSIRRILFVRYSLVITLVVVIIAVVLLFPLRSLRLRDTEKHLETEARNLAAFLGVSFAEGSTAAVADIVESGLVSPSERITIINSDGRVLSDSAAESSEMKNHANRPEVAKALEGEVSASSRVSATVGKGYIYAAAPVYAGHEIVGVVRISVESSGILSAIIPTWLILVAGFLVLLLLLFIVTLWTERMLTGDLREINEGAEKMVVGNDLEKMPQPKLSELFELARNLEAIAGKVRGNMGLVESERDKLEAILVNISIGVIVVDTSGRIELINRVARKMLGIGGREVLGKRFTEVHHTPAIEDAIEKSKSGVDVSEEVLISIPRESRVLIKAGAIKSEDEEISGVICVLEDITKTRRLERIRRDFIANVSHELRTPVANLRAIVDALVEGAHEDRERAKHFLESIDKESFRLMGLIEDLLVLSRLESEEFLVKEETFDLSRLIDDAIEDKSGLSERLSVRVDTGDLQRPVMVSADRELIRIAFSNLLDNALKYNKPGGSVRVYCFREEEKIVILVTDTGIGIPRSERKRVFERFYRVDRARSRETGGTGLGLSIVKHVAELHKGTVSLESGEGEGSTFRLEIPEK